VPRESVARVALVPDRPWDRADRALIRKDADYEYHACGQRVYFVPRDWYREHVMAQAPQGRGERIAGNTDAGMGTATGTTTIKARSR
jgi:hypothetical protein